MSKALDASRLGTAVLELAQQFGIVENVDVIDALMDRRFETVENWLETIKGARHDDYVRILSFIACNTRARGGLNYDEDEACTNIHVISRMYLLDLWDINIRDVDERLHVIAINSWWRYGFIFE